MSTTSRESLSPEFLRLQAEARHARERYQLYKGQDIWHAAERPRKERRATGVRLKE